MEGTRRHLFTYIKYNNRVATKKSWKMDQTLAFKKNKNQCFFTDPPLLTIFWT